MEAHQAISTKEERAYYSLIVENVHPDHERRGWLPLMVKSNGYPDLLV